MLAVSNGTTAIQLAYLGLGLKPGDEIIVPGFSFMAAANIALHMGLKPVFAEVDKDTWCLSAKELPKYISSKTKAIVPIHTYGNVCDMDAVMKIADERGITVIEDCAESLFSKYKKMLFFYSNFIKSKRIKIDKLLLSKLNEYISGC